MELKHYKRQVGVATSEMPKMIGGSTSKLPKKISVMAEKIGVTTSEMPEVTTVLEDCDYCRSVYKRYKTLAAAEDILSKEIRFWMEGKEVSFKRWYRRYRAIRKSVRKRARAEAAWEKNRRLFLTSDASFFSHRIAVLKRSGMSVRVWDFDPEDPEFQEKERAFMQAREAKQMIEEYLEQQKALQEVDAFIARQPVHAHINTHSSGTGGESEGQSSKSSGKSSESA
jgi:hypothetical protein